MEKLQMKQYNVGPYFCYRIPGLVCMESGKLIAYCECRQSGSDWAEIDIALQTSKDGGKTWSKDMIIARGNGNTKNNPVVIADKKDLIILWQENYSRTFLRRSADEGESWSEPEEITASTKIPEYDWTVIAYGPGHGIVLRNGRYIVPVWLASNHADPKAHHPSVISTLYSDDRGLTWHMGEIITFDGLINPSEAALAELPDGSVIFNGRNESECKKRFIAYSKNGSDGWYNKHYDDTLIDPVCMGGMVQKDGILYFSNCHSQTNREDLTIHASKDGGVTWEKIADISKPAGYSDIAVSPDGKTLYVYFEEFYYDDRNYNLVFAALDNPCV